MGLTTADGNWALIAAALFTLALAAGYALSRLANSRVKANLEKEIFYLHAELEHGRKLRKEGEEIPSIKCPSCTAGERDLIPVFLRRDGTGGKPVQLTPEEFHRLRECPVCDGVGLITDKRQQWIKHGACLKNARIRRGLGLREAALKWGMQPSDLSDLEMGRVDNLSWELSDAGAEGIVRVE